MLKLHCLAAFIIISFSQALSQNQQIADSLVKVYYQEDEGDSGRLRLLSEIAFFQTHPDSILKYAKLLIDLADQNSEPFWMNKGVFYRGSANQLKGNYDLAFADFFTTLNYDIETNNQKGISQSSLVIANTYSSLGDSRNAVNYYKKVVSQSRAISDTLTLATALYNAGDEYLNAQKPGSALVFFYGGFIYI